MQQNQINIAIPSGENKLRIKRENLAKQDIPSWFVFCYHLNPTIFKNKFREYGIKIENEADLASLVRLALSGGDKKGLIVIDGKPVYFDSLKIINSINLKAEEIQKGLREKFIIED